MEGAAQVLREQDQVKRIGQARWEVAEQSAGRSRGRSRTLHGPTSHGAGLLGDRDEAHEDVLEPAGPKAVTLVCASWVPMHVPYTDNRQLARALYGEGGPDNVRQPPQGGEAPSSCMSLNSTQIGPND